MIRFCSFTNFGPLEDLPLILVFRLPEGQAIPLEDRGLESHPVEIHLPEAKRVEW